MKSKNKIKLAIIGNGKWGKKIYQNFNKYKNIETTIFSKSGRGNSNKLTSMSKLKYYDLVYVATTEKKNSEFSRYLICNKINTICEKPLFKNINVYKTLLNKNLYSLFKVNYIYKIYNNYLRINKIIKKRKIKKIFLFFSSTSKKNLFNECKWEWLPHILSIVDYFGLLKVKSFKIKRKFKNYFLNIHLKNNSQINCIFGNNFKKKIRYQKIYFLNKEFIKINDNNITSKLYNKKIKKTPVEVLINDTLKILGKKKIYSNKDLHKTLIYNKYIQQIKL